MPGKRPRRRLQEWISRLVVAGASLVVSLAAAEVVLRLVGGEPWYERMVEEQTATTEQLFLIDDFRFPLRAGLDTTAKSPETFRIFFFGDSFTYGEGLEDPSETFVNRTIARLNERQPLARRRRFEAFNGGMPGSLTPHWVALSDRTLERYDPDLVVVVFFLRDGLAGVTSIGQIDLIRAGMQQLAKDSFFFRYSNLYRLYEERRSQTELARRYLAAMRDGYLGDPTQTAQWQRAQADILEIKRQASQVGARFALVIFPVLFELNDDYPLLDVCDEIERFCRTNGIPVHSLLPAFLGRDAEPLWLSAYDQHPNARGHEIATHGLYPFMEERVLATAMR